MLLTISKKSLMKSLFQKLQAWIMAARPRTLPLALASIGLGAFLAGAEKNFNLTVFILSALTTLFLQVLSNLANDYGDALSGIDNENREGPSRAVQSGAITLGSMKLAIILFSMLSFVSGLLLLIMALEFNTSIFIFFLVLGLFAILAAIAYTYGKRPYGYVGLGDVFVMLFFGIVGVLGSFYLYTGYLNYTYLLPALSCGFFSTAVLNINNIRDISTDAAAGKKSIPVRLGREKSVIYHWILLGSGILCSLIFIIISFKSVYQLLFLLTIPLLIKNGLAVKEKSQSGDLDPYLKQMALATLLYVITFGLGNLF